MSRILVIKLSSLGDLFHALPAVHLIRKATDATVDWVTQPEYADLARCFTDVDRVIPFPRRSFMAGFPAFEAALKKEKYDLVLDMQGLLKSAFVARLARGARRVGPSFSREGARLFYDEVSGPTNKNRHAVDENLDVARHLGASIDSVVFPLRFPETKIEAPEPHIAMLVRSRWTTKNWPAANFIAAGKALLKQTAGTIFLLGSPDDASTCAEIERGLGERVVNRCGKTNLVELGSLLQEMDLLVTVDSGPMHMAAALGIPVVAVFGATDPKRTGPYGERHRVVVRGKLTCQPCLSRTCLRPQKDTLCLTDLPPAAVIEAALKVLNLGLF